jgi:hypothetical protein
MRVEIFKNKPDESRKFSLIENLIEDIDSLYEDYDFDEENTRKVEVEIREKKIKYRLELLKNLTHAKI